MSPSESDTWARLEQIADGMTSDLAQLRRAIEQRNHAAAATAAVSIASLSLRAVRLVGRLDEIAGDR